MSDDSLYAQSNNGDSTAADEAKEKEKKTDILNDVQLQIHYSNFMDNQPEYLPAKLSKKLCPFCCSNKTEIRNFVTINP